MTTTRLVEWFEKEATGYLASLERGADALAQDPESLDALRAASRALAGAARLAGEDRVCSAAAALERGLRAATVQTGTRDELVEDIRLSVTDLRYLLDAEGSADMLDARARVVASRWSDADVPAEAEGAGAATDSDYARFVVREVDGIADAMDQGIAAFAEDPSNREWLGTILRRQRTLLGSARLDRIPVLPETLRAVEDLCELIVRLGVPVKSEWLDVFRSAREVLRLSSEALAQGEEPAQTPALSRLRTLREELVARYGERAASRATGTEEDDAAEAVPEPAAPPDPRQRAAVLRAEIAQALGDQSGARESLDELYGLLMAALR